MVPGMEILSEVAARRKTLEDHRKIQPRFCSKNIGVLMLRFRHIDSIDRSVICLLHEGASAAWSVVGIQAFQADEAAALKLIDGGRHG